MKFEAITAILLSIAALGFTATAQAATPTIEGIWCLIKLDNNHLPVSPCGDRTQISHIGQHWFVTGPEAAEGRTPSNDFTVIDADDTSIAFDQDQWIMRQENGVFVRDHDSHSGWHNICQLADGGAHLECQSSVYGPDTEGLGSGPSVYQRQP